MSQTKTGPDGKLRYGWTLSMPECGPLPPLSVTRTITPLVL